MERIGRTAVVAAVLFLTAANAAATRHADLSLEMSLPPRIAAWRPIEFYATVRNNGPDTAENVTVLATASNGASVLTSFDCGGPDPTRCPTIAAGNAEYLEIRIPHDGSDVSFRLDLRVVSTTNDVDSTNDSVSGTLQISNAPFLRFTLSSPVADPGELVEYEARIYNDLDNDATHVSFTLPLTEGWTFGESLSPELVCAPSPEEVRCSLSRVAALQAAFVRFTLRAPLKIEGAWSIPTRITLTTDRGIFDETRGSAYFYRTIYRHLVVTHTGDDGDGSLRQAVLDANAGCSLYGVPCKIVFDIESDDPARVQTIRLLTPLPKITAGSLIIDGATQRIRHGDSNPDGPEIEINGSKLTSGNGLESNAQSYSQSIQIRNLVVNGFPENGIVLQSGSHVVRGCYIGTDATGRRAVPNRLRGVVIANSGSSTINTNIISGNARSGIYIASGSNVSIYKNRIGAAAGTELEPLGNGASGIYFGPRVYGCSAFSNLIAFNAHAGIALDSTATDIALSANAITTNGSLAIDYGLDGVTPNTPQPRSLPNFPILTAARYDQSQGKTIIDGHLDVAFVPSFISDVEFFASESARRDADLFLGRVSQAGQQFHFEYEGDLRGRYVTATFTQQSSYYPEYQFSKTSELSDPIRVEGEASGPFDHRASLPRGADLALSLSASTYAAAAGERRTIYLAFTNLGPSDAQQVNLSVHVQGAAALRMPASALCQLVNAEEIHCSEQQLVAGAGEFLTFEVEAPLEKRTIQITASLSSATEDPDRTNNEKRASFEVTTAPYLNVRVASPGATDPDALATYRIQVKNYGRIDARDVTITIPLRSGWSFVGAEGGDWRCSAQAPGLVCSNPVVEAGSEQTFSFTLHAPSFSQVPLFERVQIRTANGLLGDPYDGILTAVVQRFVVTTTADSGPGSLRDVIAQANGRCGGGLTCKIVFALPRPMPLEGYYSIRLRTALPPITAPVSIDAQAQTERTGYTNPLGPQVELSGSDLVSGNGLEIRSGERMQIRGLAINGFPENGIAVVGQFTGYYKDRRVIADCYIGTDPTGRRAIPNRARGVSVQAPSGLYSNVDLIGNLISGNSRSGVFVTAGYDFRILSNRIGVAAGDQLLPLANGASGIYLGAVGGVRVDQNVIAFNHDMGLAIDRSAGGIGIQRNAFMANQQLAIDYGLDSVTRNEDPARPKDLPEFPLLLSAVWDEGSGVTRIEGVAARSRFVNERAIIDLYRNSNRDPSGFGQGEEWLGDVTLEPSAQPRSFSLVVPRDLRGSFVTATFTVTGGQFRWTSEFSEAIPVGR